MGSRLKDRGPRSTTRARVETALLAALTVTVSLLLVAGCTDRATVTIKPEPPTSTVPATNTTPTPSTTAPAGVPARPVPPTSTAPLPSATPVDAMRAWYHAWFAGDLLAIKRTCTTDFAKTVDAETFEGGDATDYRILGSEGAAGTIAFYISETRQDVSEKTAMTVFVTADGSGKGYLVKGYEPTPAGTQPAEKVPDSTKVVPKADAQSAVMDALRALQGNDIPAAQALFTTRFVAANQAWFAPAKGALVKFSNTLTARRHDVWLVEIKETWSGEPVSFYVNFLVSDVNGTAKIDRVQGWY